MSVSLDALTLENKKGRSLSVTAGPARQAGREKLPRKGAAFGRLDPVTRHLQTAPETSSVECERALSSCFWAGEGTKHHSRRGSAY